MSILVIGGNGFVGSNLVNFLVAKGQQVRVLDRSRKSYISDLPHVEYIYGNYQDSDILSKALKGIDIVYHLVSSSTPNTSNSNPINDVENNLIATIKLLRACVESSVKKVIFASSGGAIYGVPQYIPIQETHPTDPVCSYGINKLAIEKYLSLFYYLYKLDYAVLRISNPYGAGQNPQGAVGAVTIFLSHIFKKVPIAIWGDGEIVRDYIYIDDVVNAFYLSQFNVSQEKIFNISSGRGLSLNQLINQIKQVTSYDFEINYTEARKSDIPVNCLSNERARQLLSWHPMIDLDTGVSKTWAWVKYFYRDGP